MFRYTLRDESNHIESSATCSWISWRKTRDLDAEFREELANIMREAIRWRRNSSATACP
jgi:uncharacterized phage-associated protein